MVWRLEKCQYAFLIICVLMAWLAGAERSEELSFGGNQRDQRHSSAEALEMRRDGHMVYVDVRNHEQQKPNKKPKDARPIFANPDERGAEDTLKFDARTHLAEECEKEVVDAGTDDEKRGEAAVLHCCGTWNVVGWHEHLKEKAKSLSQQGLTNYEPHDHRANSLNLQKQMELNEYISLIVGCDFCKCDPDIAKASIDLHKQTSAANEDYLDNMNNYGGGHLVSEYNHMAHLSHIFDSMASNMSIRRTIDTANHAIDLSQEVARITKNYKERMNMMSDGGHSIMKNITSFAKNPAYVRVKEDLADYGDKINQEPGRQVDFRSLRTFVERMGVIAERPDAKFKYYRILPTELRKYNGRFAQVRHLEFVSQAGNVLKPTCLQGADRVLKPFAGLTFDFEHPVKLGKLGFIPTQQDPDKDMLRFTMQGSKDRKKWTNIFNAVVPPPAAAKNSSEREKYIWVNVDYKELTPEEDPHTPPQVKQQWIYGDANQDCNTVCEARGQTCHEGMWPLSEHQFAVITLDLDFENCGQSASATVAAVEAINKGLAKVPLLNRSPRYNKLLEHNTALTKDFYSSGRATSEYGKWLQEGVNNLALATGVNNLTNQARGLMTDSFRKKIDGAIAGLPTVGDLMGIVKDTDLLLETAHDMLPSFATAALTELIHPEKDIKGTAVSEEPQETSPSWSEDTGKCYWQPSDTNAKTRCDKKQREMVRFCPCQKEVKKKFFKEEVAELANILDQFPSPSLLATYTDGKNLRRTYHDTLTKLRREMMPTDSKMQKDYGNMKANGSDMLGEPYALGGGLETKMNDCNELMDLSGYQDEKCGKLEITKDRDKKTEELIRAETRTCFKEVLKDGKGDEGKDAGGRFRYQLSNSRRNMFRWLFWFFHSWLNDKRIPGGMSWDVFRAIRDIPKRDGTNGKWADALVKHMEALVTGGTRSDWMAFTIGNPPLPVVPSEPRLGANKWLSDDQYKAPLNNAGIYTNKHKFFSKLPLRHRLQLVVDICNMEWIGIPYSDHYREIIGEYLQRDDADTAIVLLQDGKRKPIFELNDFGKKHGEEQLKAKFPIAFSIDQGWKESKDINHAAVAQVLQWLVRQERVFIHEALAKVWAKTDPSQYPEFSKRDTAVYESENADTLLRHDGLPSGRKISGCYTDVPMPNNFPFKMLKYDVDFHKDFDPAFGKVKKYFEEKNPLVLPDLGDVLEAGEGHALFGIYKRYLYMVTLAKYVAYRYLET